MKEIHWYDKIDEGSLLLLAREELDKLSLKVWENNVIYHLISYFTFVDKIFIDNNCHQYLDSQNRINLAIVCSFICGVCTCDCICYLIAWKCQLNFVKKQGLFLTTHNKCSADMDEVMSGLLFYRNIKWYKRDDLMTYIDQLKYKEFLSNKEKWLQKP